MADWGTNETPSVPHFQQVLDIHAMAPPIRDSPNYEQCIAVSYAVCGRAVEAVDHIHAARRTISEQPFHAFSCWRYSRTTATEFTDDLDEIMRFTAGEPVLPLFIRSHATDVAM
jgi:hypothetical protein